MIEML
jgi:dynein heavy chain 2